MATPTRTLLPTKEAAAYCVFKTTGALRRAVMEGCGVHLAEHQLCTTAAARGEDEAIEDVSRADDCSPSLIFKLTMRRAGTRATATRTAAILPADAIIAHDLQRNARSPSRHVQNDTRRCDRGRRSRSGREGSVRPTN